MPPDRQRISQIIVSWRERCAWMELQAEDLEAGTIMLTRDGRDVTAIQARDLRLLIRNMRTFIAWQERHGL